MLIFCLDLYRVAVHYPVAQGSYSQSNSIEFLWCCFVMLCTVFLTFESVDDIE